MTQTAAGAIWLHAVSVGEVLSCVEFLRRLRTEFPHTGIFVSSSTLAGRATADEKLRGIVHGVFYAPVDYVFAVRRVLRALRPALVVIAETEIWPNLYAEVKRTRAGLAIVNGRISDRAFHRYRRLRAFFSPVLALADSILVQSDPMRDRFTAIGAPADRLHVTGNLKFDFDPRPSPLVDRLPAGPVWIAASTMPPATADDPDEDDAVIAAFRELRNTHRDLRWILAPRKPERFDSAAKKLDAAGLKYLRRSALADGKLDFQILLLDTIGELAGLFAAADVVFMGGTLVHRGGHNLLEPAAFGKPVIAGPHLENFQAIADEFRKAGAYVEIPNPTALAAAIARLLDHKEEAGAIGSRALACAQAQRGATSRAVDEVARLYRSRVPRRRPAMPWFAIAWVMALGWKHGAKRRHALDLGSRRRLDIPVVSIGNLTMGGSGKTPCTLLLADCLKDRGRKPGILTRGYKRASPERRLLLAPGDEAAARNAGDEPQLFIRATVAAVGVGADRYETGEMLCRDFDVDILLLDDGFQHVRLARDVDILLIDALDPFGGGELFPLGRLREPVGGIWRADLVLVTRADATDSFAAIQHTIRQYNHRAPIFRASVEPEWWIEHRTGRRYEPWKPPFERVGAFCGLGNPASFRRTLAGVQVEPLDWVEFPDHHHYRPHELKRLAHQFEARGATAIITTEKDSVNLCEEAPDLLKPLDLYWLKVRMTIDGEAEFVNHILHRLETVSPSGPAPV